MQLGMVGLGRMGANIVRRLMRAATDASSTNERRGGGGARPGGGDRAASLDEFVAKLDPPRPRGSWCRPARSPRRRSRDLAARMAPGDTIIDGGNTNYQDDVRRAGELAEREIHYVDVGTSGGVFGLERGYCLMVGGRTRRSRGSSRSSPRWRPESTRRPGRRGATGEPAPEEQGYLHCGPAGAGHFVKMVHNGIEYGMMAALAEGLNILHGADAGNAAAGPGRRDGAARRPGALPVRRSTCQGSPRSGGEGAWSGRGSSTSPLRLCRSRRRWSGFAGRVSDSGEGRWTRSPRSRRACRRMCSPRRCSRGSARGARAVYADSCSRRCGSQFGGHREKPLCVGGAALPSSAM